MTWISNIARDCIRKKKKSGAISRTRRKGHAPVHEFGNDVRSDEAPEVLWIDVRPSGGAIWEIVGVTFAVRPGGLGVGARLARWHGRVSVNEDVQEWEARCLALPSGVTFIIEVEIGCEGHPGGFISETVGNKRTVGSEERVEATVWTVLAVTGLDVLEMCRRVEEGKDVQRGRWDTGWIGMRWGDEWGERAGRRVQG